MLNSDRKIIRGKPDSESAPRSSHCYTPGPWVFGDGGWDGDYPYLNIYYEDDAPLIASVLSEETGIDVAKKNASLICAAPAMLEALELVKKYGGSGETEDGTSVSFFVNAAIKAARELP